MFDGYSPLMKLFHVVWLSRRYQLLSITDSTSATRMVSPTSIMLELLLLYKNTSWDLSVMGSICKNSCGEV